MTCLRDHEHGADLLIGYLEGTLTPEERHAIDLHALACADCRGLLAVQETLDDYPVPEVSPDFDARLYARIAVEEAKPSWWSRFGSWVWRPAIPLAAAAAVVAGAFWMREPAPNPADIDPQQLEQALQDLELLMPPMDEI